jgi:hypothetical protein
MLVILDYSNTFFRADLEVTHDHDHDEKSSFGDTKEE